MKRFIIRTVLAASLLPLSWYALHSESSFPDYVLDALQILKKPIEELLPDLQTNDNSDAILTTALDIDAYQEMKNSRQRWNEMRQRIEAGRSLYDPLPSEIALSTSVVGRLAPEVPPPPGFTVQLPYESRLTVSGRKTIGMVYRSTRYTDSAFAQTQGLRTGQSSFELQQQLQVRINGQVGRKVTVNVDFDDTKEDKRDISIVYKGDPDELVQRAAFGDINLSLPQTEFAGYSKQVFGATAELKYKALKGYFIGSRTKGQTETKEFVGNVILQRVNIADTAYIRRRFYNYTALTGRSGDKNVDVATVKVYVDTQDITRSTASLTQFSPYTALLPNAVSYPNGNFIQLIQGIDYTVDPSSGVITFRNILDARTVVAIDYAPQGQAALSQQFGAPVMLKYDENSVTQIPATEELTHYNIGAIKLVRDNNQGNFTLQLRDLNDANIGASVGVQYLPNNQGQILVDFEAGTFVLSQRLPFTSVYLQSPSSQSRFFVEYRSRVKTYTLRPNIIINSERILLNGRLLIRDQDYFIDYQSGFITFFNEDQITDSTRITATYDFSPFGIAGQQTDTLVGARTELSMSPLAPILASSLLGSTVIYDFAPKQTAAPDIRQTSGSFLVTEADVSFKDLIFNPMPLLKSSFSGEVARSARNPNTFGKALIDNMEGIKDDTSISMNKLGWQISSNPTVAGAATYFDAIGVVNVANNSTDNLTNDLVPTLDINPGASALASDRTLVLNVRYDLTRSSEASIATVISPTGVDFSKKLFMEMWVQGDGSVSATPSQTRMNVTLGQISENFDASGLLKTEDANRNNSLDANEDVGISYLNPDASSTTLGANNLRIDSNDLDRNGILNSENATVGGDIGYRTGAVGQLDFGSGSTGGASAINTVDHSGWKFVRVPLNISSNTASNWSAIKEVRVSLKPTGIFGTTGTIRIAKISIVGNRWEAQAPEVLGSSLTVKAINNEDDSGYTSPAGYPDFDALNQVNTALTGPTPTKRREQSLALSYNFTTVAGTVTARSVTISPMDFTAYGSIRFFVYKRTPPTNDTSGTNLIFRAGSDNDYWEFSVPVASLPPNSWTQIRINQVGSDRPDQWQSGTAGGSVRRVGSPNLASVSQLKYGFINQTAASTSGELWIDELYASDVITRIGYASRMNADFEVMGWGTWGLGRRDIDRNFETFTSALSNQDRREENAYLTVSRLNWFPMKFTGLRRRTITPLINSVGNTTLVSIQQEGRVTQNNYTAQGTLQFPKWPTIGLTYESDKVDSDNLFRVDKKNAYGATVDYSLPVKRRYLPENVQLTYKISKLNLDFDSGAFLNASDPFSVSDTRNDTRDLTAKATFQPFNGFTFTPNYSLSTTSEEKDVLFSTSTSVDGSTVTLKYDKSRIQKVGLDSVLGLTRWMSPRLRYSMSTTETYGIPLVSNLLASNQKTVDRQGNTDLTWDFAWRDFSRKMRTLQSMNVVTSYLLDDGDSWEKVNSGYGTSSKLSVRSTLGSGTRRQQTLQDTLRSTMRWSPFDWASNWSGPRLPLRTLSLTSTYTGTQRRTDTTGTVSKINTRIFPDIIVGMAQTEHFFGASRFMSNSQMNIKHQLKKVDTVDRTFQKSTTWGGDWRFTFFKKLDLFTTYTRTNDKTEDKVNKVTTSDGINETFGVQLGFNVGKWRFSPKYDQNKQEVRDSSNRLTTDLRTRKPALQVYADLYLPAGLKLPFSDVIVFSNRIRTTNTISLEQKRSSLNSLRDNSDTYSFSTSNDYELTSLIRLQVGGKYDYIRNKQSSEANSYAYEFNSLLTIQF